MKSLLRVHLALFVLVTASSAVFAQGLVLKNRSVIEFNIGMWGGSKVSNTIGVTGIQSTADASSFVGSIVYAYGIREEMSVTLSAGMLGASASANVGTLGVSQQAGAVVPVLLGIRYYVPYPDPGARVRPFLSLGVGTYIGSESSSSIGLTVVQQTHTETAFGSRIGAGIDFYFGNSFKIVANAGYNVMTDFSTPVTGRSNFDGGDFSLGVGLAL